MNIRNQPFRRELPALAPGAYSHALTVRQQYQQQLTQQTIQRSRAAAIDSSKRSQAIAYNASQAYKKYR